MSYAYYIPTDSNAPLNILTNGSIGTYCSIPTLAEGFLRLECNEGWPLHEQDLQHYTCLASAESLEEFKQKYPELFI